MVVASCILQYFEGNPIQELLMLQDFNLQILACFNLDRGACPLTWCSLIGYFIMFGGSPTP